MYDTVGRTFHQGWLSDLEGNRTLILDAFLGRTCADGTPKVQALFRVMSLNLAWPDAEDWLHCRSFLQKIGCYLEKLWPQGMGDGLLLASDVLFGAPASLIADLDNMISLDANWRDGSAWLSAVDFGAAMERRVSHRRLFETEGGRLGLGPPGTRAGDKICILHGYPGPFCLEAEEVGSCQGENAVWQA
ncbi:hypothetical protein B0T25DRAFT_634517 [Lasiosphaeria hispida]|uniref:Uncharacterized protein n=1 Tax=Lasiosphaeria hispida TaxID=260671 RepID=A0AAJ0H7U9_9PEZI|nr:hypothetical protein B0T25DRAFT_634517 [Lasiosphaeria hispida]